MLIKLLHTE